MSLWVALALLFANSVIWPDFLDGPVSTLGDLHIHWFPIALLVWAIAAAVWRSQRLSRGVRLSTPYPRAPELPE